MPFFIVWPGKKSPGPTQLGMADKAPYETPEAAAEAAVVRSAAKTAAGYPDDDWVIVEAESSAKALLKCLGIPEPPGGIPDSFGQ